MKTPPAKPNKLDRLGRRSRLSRKSTGVRVELTKADLLRFAFLQRHGDLPTSLIHQYTQYLGMVKNLHATRRRLGKLFHERNTPHNGPYLDRNHNQQYTANSDYHFAVYRVNDRSIKALKEARLHVEHIPRHSNSWKHDFLRSCYSASMELMCLKHSEELEYIPHHEIVGRTGMDSFTVDGMHFTPDLIHGIRYKDSGTARLYMVEIDCHTEQLRTTARKRFITFEKKLELYRKYIAGGVYKEDFGIRGGILLAVVTTNRTHMHNLMALAGNSNFMLFNTVPDFDFGFIPPAEPFELLKAAWTRPGKDDFYMNVA